MRRAARSAGNVAFLLLAVLVLHGNAAGDSSARRPFARGMVVSCPRYGQVWGSPDMAATLTQLEQLGVGWVAIHPYAGVRKDGTIRREPAAETGYLPAAIELAAKTPIRLFWKPHLAYWGSFTWRGAIEFGHDERAWRRFFAQYREFIVDQARFAELSRVELFAVGVEYEKTTHRDKEWRDIIAAVRRVYSGRITYAANWDSLDRVPFWDAVDVIGVHAYFPLADGSDPDSEELERGWEAPLKTMGDLSARFEKPIVLAEIGYNRSPQAAMQPWDNTTTDSAQARALRARLIEVAMKMLESQPFIEGMFWWKWMPGAAPWDRDFSMKDPEALEVLQRVWAAPASAAVTPSGD